MINKNVEVECRPPRLHTAMGAQERSKQSLRNLITTNLDEKVVFTASVSYALRVKRFEIQTGGKVAPTDLQNAENQDA